MRIYLPGLFQRHLLKKGRAAESLRARRERNHPYAQGAASRSSATRRRRRTPRQDTDQPRPQRLPLLRLRRPPRRVLHARARSRRVFLSRTRLNKPGSEKETWHVELDLAGTGIDYAVGDAFGIFPTNDPALADAVIAALHAPPDFPIGGRALRDVLIDGVSLGAAPDMLFQLFSYITGGERRQKAKALAAGEDPDGDAATLDVLAAIQKFSGRAARSGSLRRSARSAAATALFDRVLAQGRPQRAWRSASTPCAIPIDGRTRLGVASTFLGDRVGPGRSRQGLRPEGRAFRPARRSIAADHHDRPGHRHRAVSRLSARAHGNQGTRPQLAVLRPPAPATTISSTRTSSPA